MPILANNTKYLNTCKEGTKVKLQEHKAHFFHKNSTFIFFKGQTQPPVSNPKIIPAYIFSLFFSHMKVRVSVA